MEINRLKRLERIKYHSIREADTSLEKKEVQVFENYHKNITSRRYSRAAVSTRTSQAKRFILRPRRPRVFARNCSILN